MNKHKQRQKLRNYIKNINREFKRNKKRGTRFMPKHETLDEEFYELQELELTHE